MSDTVHGRFVDADPQPAPIGRPAAIASVQAVPSALQQAPGRDMPSAAWDALPEAIAMLDAHGRVTGTNAAWRAGAPGRDMLGMHYTTLLPIDHAAAASGAATRGVHTAIARALAEGQAAHFDLPAAAAPTDAWIRISILPVPGTEAGVLLRRHAVPAPAVAATDAPAGATSAPAGHDALFLSAIDHATHGIFLHAPGGTVLEVNDQACRQLGYARAALIGQPVELFASSLPPDVHFTLDARLEAGEVLRFETTHRRSDGSSLPVAVSVRAFRAGGRSLRVSVVEDITDSDRARLAMQSSADRLEKIAGRLPGVVYQCRLRPDGTYTFPYVSEGAREIFRRSPEELMHDAYLAFATVHEDDYPALRASVRRSAETLTPWQHRFRQQFEDGTERELISNAMPEREPDGSVLWHGFIADVSAQTRAETAQRVSDAVLASISQGVLVSGVDGRIVVCNPAYSAIRGYTERDLIGRHVSTLRGTQPLGVGEEIDRARAAGVEYHGEFLDSRKDGTTFWHDLTVTPVRDPVGRLTHFVGVSRDISERKAAEAELALHREQLETLVRSRTAELVRALDAAESASRAKSVFLANMSHELRTPMAGIIGMTELAQRLAVDPQQIDYLQKSAGASQHLLEIINDVLDLSRIESGHLTLRRERFCVGRIVEETLELAAPRARAKGLRLGADIDPTLPELVIGDATRVRQILLNYVDNAVKFAGRGAIVLRAHVDRRDAHELMLRIAVEDAGPGIATRDMARLFEPFEQGDNSTTRLAGGTGLGLAISRRLARLMGGDAGCDSSPGAGSAFWATMRVETSTAADEPEASPDDAPEVTLAERHSGARVLVAEDHALTRDVIRLLLDAASLDVHVVDDGAAAVAQAARNEYDLFVFDLHMPHLDGIAATQAIRRQPHHTTTPVIAVTAAVFDEDVARCAAAGMTTNVAKPFRAGDLLAAVLRALDGHRPRASGRDAGIGTAG